MLAMSKLEVAEKWLEDLILILSVQTDKKKFEHGKERLEVLRWLIDQENKYSEYVKLVEENNLNTDKELEKLFKQNKRYREAIERAVRHLKNLKIEDGANFAYLTLIKALEADEQLKLINSKT